MSYNYNLPQRSKKHNNFITNQFGSFVVTEPRRKNFLYDYILVSNKLFELKQKQIFLIEKRNYSSLVRRESLVLKKIIFCVLFFVLSWMPYAAFTLFAQYGNNVNLYIRPETIWFPTILAKTSSIYNPIIYTLSNKECKKFFKRKIFIFFKIIKK